MGTTVNIHELLQLQRQYLRACLATHFLMEKKARDSLFPSKISLSSFHPNFLFSRPTKHDMMKSIHDGGIFLSKGSCAVTYF